MTSKKIKVEDIMGDNFYVYNLESSNNNPSLNASITITCTVKNIYGDNVANKTLTLYKDGSSYGTATTNSNGVATWSNISCSNGGLVTYSVANTYIDVLVGNALNSNLSNYIQKSNTDGVVLNDGTIEDYLYNPHINNTFGEGLFGDEIYESFYRSFSSGDTTIDEELETDWHISFDYWTNGSNNKQAELIIGPLTITLNGTNNIEFEDELSSDSVSIANTDGACHCEIYVTNFIQSQNNVTYNRVLKLNGNTATNMTAFCTLTGSLDTMAKVIDAFNVINSVSLESYAHISNLTWWTLG